MPPRKKRSPHYPESKITDYRHAERRKNIPPAGLAAQGRVLEAPKARYYYDPHLPPVLRFDVTGAADRLSDLLEAATQRRLTQEEARAQAEPERADYEVDLAISYAKLGSAQDSPDLLRRALSILSNLQQQERLAPEHEPMLAALKEMLADPESQENQTGSAS